MTTAQPGAAARTAKNENAAPGLPKPSDDDSRRNPMVGATPAVAVHDAADLGDRCEDFRAADLLSPRDYGAAFDVYAAAAGSPVENPVALNRAVDAVTEPLAVEVLERLYRRLMVIADQVSTGRVDAFEFGLRVAATEARAMGRELTGELR